MTELNFRAFGGRLKVIYLWAIWSCYTIKNILLFLVKPSNYVHLLCITQD